MKALYLLPALSLMCACTSEREQTVSTSCDAAMFGLDSNVEEVAYTNCFDNYDYVFVSAKFDAEGNIIVPATDRLERDEHGRIVKYEQNYADTYSEDYACYDITYGADTDSFLPIKWAYEYVWEIGESELKYDGVTVIASHGSYSNEGEPGPTNSDLRYEYLEFDDHGNWTKRTVTGKESLPEYKYDEDLKELPGTWEWEVSYTITRTIKYRK